MKPDRIPVVAARAAIARPLRVLVVDDHIATLTALADLLEREYPRLEVVGVARDGAGTLRAVRDAQPDVVVLDLDLGGEYGLDLLPAIRRHPGIAVVILTASDDPRERNRALAAGAAAFVSKLSPVGELIAAVVAAGIVLLSHPGGTQLPDE
jgi:two-component system, NarL family, nitrate/nitrite response regulator NarL